MAKKSCKKGYYYCYSSKKCKRIPMGYYIGGGGWLRKEEEKSEDTEKKKNGNGNGANGNGNGNGESDGGSNGGGVSEAWSAKYKKSIDCDNPKGFSQRAHCRGRKKVSEEAVSKKQQKFFGIVRAIQKGEIKPTTPETAKAAKDMKKSDVKKFASTKHKGLPEKKEVKEESNPRISRKEGQPANSKKHSDLYTDENPKGTIHGLGFKDVATAKASVAKIKKSSRSHAHKIQAAIAMEQRARVMGKTSEAAVFRKFINSMKKKTKQMNEAKGGDHEVAMAQSQLKKSARNIAKLRKALGKKEKDIPAWMQAKITDTAHDTDAAAGYADKMDEEVIAEKRDGKSSKDKGYSLRDWFRGGGWKQTGGKYDGKPCAKQPGQKTKPYCRDADDRAAMSKEERNKRARKKRKEDPNPNRKGRAKNVTQESYSDWRQDLDEGKKDACYHKVKSRYSVWPSAYASGALVKCRKVGAANWGNKTKKESFSNWREDMLLEGLEDKLKGMTASQIEDLIKANKGAEDKIRETLAKMKSATPKPQGKGAQLPNIPKTTETYKRGGGEGRTTYQRGGSDRVSYQRRQTVTRADVQGGTEAAKRAASGQGRYRPGTGVTPDFKLDPKFKPPGSRGMSGRVRGRGKLGLAIGAATLAAPFVVGAIKKAFNKEDYNYSNWRDDFHATEIESVDIIKPKSLQPTQGLGSDMLGEKKDIPADVKGIAKELDKAVEMHKSQAKRLRKAGISEENINEKCWKGYEKKGMKTMFGKRYPNCVKKKKTRKEEVELDEKKDPCWDTHEMKGMKKKGNRMVPNCVPKEQVSDWRADVSLQEKKAKKDYDGDGKIETGEEEYKGSRDKAIKKAIAMKEDWQKSNRKDGVDGMSQKSVDAYKRENPGSKLKTAVTGKVKKGSKDAKRRKSFCSRSKGQKDMHNIDCTKTPDKKICKARKRWRC
tara:strand:+ start:20485 stop:23295 length:2811 start_codon:yes stop_codon:yes gene_type:complete